MSPRDHPWQKKPCSEQHRHMRRIFDFASKEKKNKGRQAADTHKPPAIAAPLSIVGGTVLVVVATGVGLGVWLARKATSNTPKDERVDAADGSFEEENTNVTDEGKSVEETDGNSRNPVTSVEKTLSEMTDEELVRRAVTILKRKFSVLEIAPDDDDDICTSIKFNTFLKKFRNEQIPTKDAINGIVSYICACSDEHWDEWQRDCAKELFVRLTADIQNQDDLDKIKRCATELKFSDDVHLQVSLDACQERISTRHKESPSFLQTVRQMIGTVL